MNQTTTLKNETRRTNRTQKQWHTKKHYQNGNDPLHITTMSEEETRQVVNHVKSSFTSSSKNLAKKNTKHTKNAQTQTNKPNVKNGGNQTKKVIIFPNKKCVNAQTQTEETSFLSSPLRLFSVKLPTLINTTLYELVRSFFFR